MIKTKYIAGIPVPEFDAAISEMVEDYGDIDGGGNDMRIVVENWLKVATKPERVAQV